jgi:DNA-binding MarR family transcriptional regulator
MQLVSRPIVHNLMNRYHFVSFDTNDGTDSMDDRSAYQLDNQLCFAIYRAGQAMNRTYKSLLTPLGLTYPQFLVMLVLWEHGELSVKQIGGYLGLDSGTLTPLLKRMEQSGFVTRRRDALDERIVRVAATDAGHRLRVPACKAMDTLREKAAIASPDLDGLRNVLHRLSATLENEAVE